MTMHMQTCAPEPAGTILIVEDDRDIASMLAETLAQNGFATVAVNSGTEMDRARRKQLFDLIVLDVMLPGEDGFSICRRLRGEARIPIIMLTAVGADVDRIIGLEFGADDYVTKPFNTRELLARIKGLLRRASYGLERSERSERSKPMTFEGWRVDPIDAHAGGCDGVAGVHDECGVRPSGRALPQRRTRADPGATARADTCGRRGAGGA
jgi:two-component system OmpR family response regulator